MRYMSDNQLFNQLYSQLNEAQRQAVDTIEGPVVVNAGPGTGKTQILTLRIAHILQKQGGDLAENILALTFTKAGVTAMRQRLSSIIGSAAYRVGIFTFHSFAEHLIRSHSDIFVDHISSNLMSEIERLNIVEQIIKQGEYHLLKPFTASSFFVQPIINAIDELKRDAISPEDLVQWNEALKQDLLQSEDVYYKRKGSGFKKGDLKRNALRQYEKNLELIEAYTSYETALSEKKLYDYNDLIITVIKALESDSEFQYTLQEQYQYILLDEQQDSNAGQNRIVELLTNAEHLNGQPNLFTVGDDKQAIYRFQGASLKNFLSFEQRHRQVVSINLNQNYRSGQEILDVAHSLITQDASEREHQPLSSHCPSSKVTCHEFNSYADELDFVAQEITHLIAQGVGYKDIAILYRENRHTDEIQKALSRYGLPSVVMARENILETSLVYKVLLLLRCVCDLTDNHHLAKLLYSDVFETTAYDVARIVERFGRNKRRRETGTKHLFKIIQNTRVLREIGVENPEVFLSLATILQRARTSFGSKTFLGAFDNLMKRSGLIEKMISDPSSADQLRYYDRLYEELRTLVQANPTINIFGVVNHFKTYQQYDLSLDAKPSDYMEGVRLLTAHKSKGLEYQHVFVTNLVDRVWGNKTSRRWFELPTGIIRGDNDDERRLLYVGLTRAREQCILSFSRNNGERDTDPSLFLYDLDQGIVKWEKHHQSIELSTKHRPVDQKINDQDMFDDDLIISLYEKRPLSITALNNYLDCPGRYFVNHLLQIPVTYSRPLSYGLLIHQALELFFRKSREADTILSQEELLEIFARAVDQAYLTENEGRDILKQGTASLAGYHKRYAKNWSPVAENEMRIDGVVLALETSTVTLTGVLDRVEPGESERELKVIDYKTGKTFNEAKRDRKTALERQLIFYSLLLDLYREGHFTMTSGVLDFIEPHRETGVYEQHQLFPTTEDRTKLISEIQQMDEEIRQGKSFLDTRCGKADCDACKLLHTVRDK